MILGVPRDLDCCVKIWNVEQLLSQPDPESSIEKQTEILHGTFFLLFFWGFFFFAYIHTYIPYWTSTH